MRAECACVTILNPLLFQLTLLLHTTLLSGTCHMFMLQTRLVAGRTIVFPGAASLALGLCAGRALCW